MVDALITIQFKEKQNVHFFPLVVVFLIIN